MFGLSCRWDRSAQILVELEVDGARLRSQVILTVGGLLNDAREL